MLNDFQNRDNLFTRNPMHPNDDSRAESWNAFVAQIVARQYPLSGIMDQRLLEIEIEMGVTHKESIEHQYQQ
jgi:hypothetical protein